MEYKEARQKFIGTWGSLGSNWGINKTMAQIHALLLISEIPVCTEDIMDELSISRGNANMNIRALIDWGLVHREVVPGERKDFFTAGKDIWKVALQIIRERRRRELEPVMSILSNMKDINASKGEQAKLDEFNKVIEDLDGFTGKVDKMLETLLKSDKNWFQKNIIRLLT